MITMLMAVTNTDANVVMMMLVMVVEMMMIWVLIKRGL